MKIIKSLNRSVFSIPRKDALKFSSKNKHSRKYKEIVGKLLMHHSCQRE